MKSKFVPPFLILFLIILISGCQTGIQLNDSDVKLKANALSKDLIIIDTHLDVPLHLYYNWFDITQRSDKRDFDYPRAVEGGLDVAFMAIFTSPDLEGTGKSKPLADSLISVVNKMQTEWPDKFLVVNSVSELLDNVNKGKILLPMGMENGSPIENNLNNLNEFYAKGIRYITLSHWKSNHICDAATDPERIWNGLSPFGEKVVKEMNRLGMIVDVSHISDSAFFDIIKLSKAPVMASHSSCRYFTPGNERNVSDDMLKALAKNDGIININFASIYLTEKSYNEYLEQDKEEEKLRLYLKENNLDPQGPEARELFKNLREEFKISKASVKDLADHIDHVKSLIGIDYVGIGSDYDGLGDILPVGLEDVSKYPNLINELLLRGYSDEEIRKVFGGNFLRVWKKVEEVSQASK